MFQTIIVMRRSGLDVFEWLKQCLKRLGYTIDEMDISRQNSSCRFDFWVLIKKAAADHGRL